MKAETSENKYLPVAYLPIIYNKITAWEVALHHPKRVILKGIESVMSNNCNTVRCLFNL